MIRKLIYVYRRSTIRVSKAPLEVMVLTASGPEVLPVAILPNQPVDLRPGVYRAPADAAITVTSGSVGVAVADAVSNPDDPPRPLPPDGVSKTEVSAFLSV